jgi:hypothetical protein
MNGQGRFQEGSGMKVRPGRNVVGLFLIGMALWFVYGEERSAAELAPGVSLKSVKYGELAEFVRGSKGKVVVVDVWGEF